METPADIEPFLKPTPFIESELPAVRAIVGELGVEKMAPAEKARTLAHWVRDNISYGFMAAFTREQYVTSEILNEQHGFCVQKAVVLCALGRAAGLPTALLLCDLRDRSLSPMIVKALKTDIMHHHGLNAFYLDGKWVKVDASLSPDVTLRKNVATVEFDGRADALFSDKTLDGRPYADYIAWHGYFADLPFQRLVTAYRVFYRNVDTEALGLVDHRM